MKFSGKGPVDVKPKRAFLAGLVPLTSRPTLYYDLRSAPFNGIYFGVIALMPWVAKHTLQASDTEVAVLMAAPAAANLLTVYWAHLVAGRPKMPFVLWAGIAARALMLAVGFAVNSLMLVVLATLAYLVGNIATPALNSIWRNNYPGTHRYGVVGAVLTVTLLVTVVVSLAAGWALKEYDERLFRVFFPAAAIVGMAGVYVFSRVKVRGETRDFGAERSDREAFSILGSLGVLLRDRKFGIFMLMQFIVGFSNLLTGAVLVRLLKDQDANYLTAALALSVAPNALMVLTMPLWGRMLQKMNPWRARSVFSVIWIAGGLCIALSGNHVWMVIAGQAIAGAAFGGGSLLWNLQQMYFAPREEVPRYMGVHCTLTGIRGLTAPFLGVALMGLWGTHTVFFLSVGGFVVGEMIALTMAGKEHKEGGGRGHVDGAGFAGEQLNR